MYGILDKIDSPADIKGLTTSQLKQLCKEIRNYMVECCSVTPGHLGSSLGAVELIVGLHYVYDTPFDNLIFDVSHQAYAHKIITGRREAFKTLRTEGGISGFTRRDESPYDSFVGGHASTSISAALGMAKAATLKGNGSKTVALIGDASLSGGMAFEGLNNAGDSCDDLLIIVNDNNMSIEENIGALHSYLLELTTDPLYNNVKNKVWDSMGDIPLRRKMQQFVMRLKNNLILRFGGDLFQALGFRYFGPIDGNDIEVVVKTLKRIKELKGPRVLHTITKKGKGYAPAEASPTAWHAPGVFDPETGERAGSSPNTAARYQDVFGEYLLELAKADESIVGVTPAMAYGCGMDLLASAFPERFFDVGIAEEHAVTFSAGLAACGMKPFCNIYSSFAQRSYDQIIHDVALQKLPVVICLDRAGIVGEDGPTHHGTFDLAALRCIPNCTIAAPRNEMELKNMMYTASLWSNGPFIIRYPRGRGEGMPWREIKAEQMEIGKAEKIKDGKSGIAIAAIGPVANRACEIGMDVTVWDVRFLKPMDSKMIEDLFSGKYHTIISVEDGCIKGGLFGALAEEKASRQVQVTIEPVGIGDNFVSHGKQKDLLAEYGLNTEKILEKVLQVWK